MSSQEPALFLATPTEKPTMIWGLIERVVKFGTGFVALVYAAGFLVVSVNHGKYGIVMFEFLRAKVFCSWPFVRSISCDSYRGRFAHVCVIWTPNGGRYKISEIRKSKIRESELDRAVFHSCLRVGKWRSSHFGFRSGWRVTCYKNGCHLVGTLNDRYGPNTFNA
jgi:hypothetical protein